SGRLCPGFETFNVCIELTFIVGCTAGVDRAVAYDRLKRIGIPAVFPDRRLDIVMTVDEDRRPTRDRGTAAEDNRVARRFDKFGFATGLLQAIACQLGSASNVGSKRGVAADAGNP